jgi:hypothetical protein
MLLFAAGPGVLTVVWLVIGGLVIALLFAVDGGWPRSSVT